MGMPWFSILIKVGTIAGLTSVMLILTYGQSRIFYAMARDGLLPRLFSTLHPKFRTPWLGTIILGILIAIAAAMLPITILGDLVSLGTAAAFGIVCLSVHAAAEGASGPAPAVPRAVRAGRSRSSASVGAGDHGGPGAPGHRRQGGGGGPHPGHPAHRATP